jgi:hypothetical protein
MDAEIKEWLQDGAWFAAFAGLIVAIVKLWIELKAGRIQREGELRWRQAEAGKGLNDEMQTDERAWPAMQMLDSNSRSYEIREGEWVTITSEDVARALMQRTEEEGEDEKKKAIFIRDCFDTLFYFFAMFDHYISNSLILPDDVAYPVEYYVPRLAQIGPQVAAYLQEYGLQRAQDFLMRYPAWSSAMKAEASRPQGPARAAA